MIKENVTTAFDEHETSTTLEENLEGLPADLPYEGYEYPEFQRTIDECRARFEKWRIPFIERVYRHYSSRHGLKTRKKDVDDYVRRAGSDRGFSSISALPGKDYFDQILVPTITRLAKTPEEVREITRIAIRALGEMTCIDQSYRSATHAFFECASPTNPKEDGCWYWDSARNQFSYFYSLRDSLVDDRIKLYEWERVRMPTPKEAFPAPTEEERRETNEALILAAAADHRSQQWQISGGYSSRIHSLKHLLQLFSNAFNLIHPRYRARVFRAFARYGGGKHHAYPFIEKIAETFQALTEKGKEHLLDDFATIVETAPDTDEHSRAFPVFDGKKAIAEIEALQANEEFHDDLLDFAVFILNQRREHCLSSRGGVTFLTKKKEGENPDYFFCSRGTINQLTIDLEEKGYTPEEIHAILNLHKTYPWLGENAILIITGYHEINANFPGGVEALIKYLETIRQAKECVRTAIYLVENGKLPKRNLDKYLEVGQFVVAELKNTGSRYFISEHRGMGELIALVEENPEKFEKTIKRAVRFVKTFPNRYEDRENIFSIYIKYYGDPKFRELVRALKTYRSAVRAYPADFHKQESHRHPFSYQGFTRPLVGFIDNLWELSQHNGQEEDDEDAFVFRERRYNNLPPDVDIEEQIKIIIYFSFILGDSFGSLSSDYFERVKEGCDYRIAARLLHSRREPIQISAYETYHPLELGPEIPGVETPVEAARIKAVLAEITQAHKEIARASNIRVVKALPKAAPKRRRRYEEDEDEEDEDNREMMTLMEWLNDDTLGKRLRSLSELSQDPSLRVIKSHIDTAIAQIEKTLKVLVFRKMLHFPTVTAQIDVGLPQAETDGLRSLNPHAQMAITGAALLGALGVIDIPGLPREALLPIENGFHPKRLLASPSQLPEERLETLNTHLRRNLSTLSTNIRILVPHLRALIHEERLKNVGRTGIGGKIHTQNPMSQGTLRTVLDIFNLGSTQFRLIHADDSLLLPPMPTALELKMLIKIMDVLGVVDRDQPEIQLAKEGRWNNDLAGQVAASMLLGTSRGVRFRHGAFATTHDDQTSSRIMAYDAGVLDTTLPFHLTAAEGRTDKLGSQILSDVGLYDVMGTLAAHAQHEGRYSDIAHRYFSRLLKILERTGLRKTLDMAPWVHDPGKPDRVPARDHERMVAEFTGTWWRHSETPGFGVITEIKHLIEGADEEMLARRDEVMRENPEEAQKMIAY